MSHDEKHPKTIVYHASDWWGVTWYRAHVPGVALKSRGHEVIVTDSIDRNWVERCDVLVTLPSSSQRILDLVRYERSRGCFTVLDIDDDYWTVHPENPVQWSAQSLDVLSHISREVDLVTTTTSELSEIMQRFNSNVRVLPNSLPDEHWPARFEPRKTSGESLVLGWAGSSGHLPDVRLVYPLFGQLLEEFAELNVEIVGLPALSPDEHARITHPPRVKIEQYPDVLAGFDIGIAPLLDTRFNRCKSDLKFLEYSMVGIPTIASHVAPYSRSIKHGVNGYLAKNSKDWLKYLRLLISDTETRVRISKEARAFAETRLISKTVNRWIKAYGLDA